MKIGVDLDAVLGDIMTPLTDFHNRKYGTKHKLEDNTNYDLSLIWGCSKDEVVSRVYEFYFSPQLEQILPIEGAIDGVKKLAEEHELHVITSRPYVIDKPTRKWINKHFPNQFRSIFHTNQMSKSGTPRKKKSEACKQLGIELIIDDHTDFVFDCVSIGIKAFLFDAPWNQAAKKNINVVRVKSWKEIVKRMNLVKNA